MKSQNATRFCLTIVLGLFFVRFTAAALAADSVHFSESARSVDRYDFVEVTMKLTQPPAGNPFADAEFTGAVMATSYRGPLCIEVEDDTFGQTLAGRKRALKFARNVLQPYLA